MRDSKIRACVKRCIGNCGTKDADNLTLAEIGVGQRARISGLCFEGACLRRLIDLGFFGGAEVQCVGQSPMGDPRAYEVRGAVVAIRGVDAARISVTGCCSD